MRFGVCIGNRGREYVPVIRDAGYDYIEGTFCNVKEMEENEFMLLMEDLKKNGIFFETLNGYFPKVDGLTVVGENADFQFLKEYSKVGFERASMLGGKVVVIGSGKSRIIPEGFSYEKAKDQYAAFLSFCGDLAMQYGMKVVVEPLNRKETNFINTVEECIEMCKFTGNKNVFALADFFHMFMNGEGLSAVENAGNMLQHVHIARANEDRAQPSEADRSDCEIWARALKKCGYNDRLTLESRFVPDFETAIKIARPMMELFN